MTRKVKRVPTPPGGVALPYSVPPGGELWGYQVNWDWKTVVPKEAVTGTNLETEAMYYAQESWDEFLDMAGVRDIELGLRHLWVTLCHLQIKTPMKAEDHDLVLDALKQLEAVFTRIARLRDVDLADDDTAAILRFY